MEQLRGENCKDRHSYASLRAAASARIPHRIIQAHLVQPCDVFKEHGSSSSSVLFIHGAWNALKQTGTFVVLRIGCVDSAVQFLDNVKTAC